MEAELLGSEPAGRSFPEMPIRVLVVEDEPLILLDAVEMLEGLGYEPLEAANGINALALLEAERFDVLLTDVGLPDISGLELARFAISKQPDICIVFATGHSEIPGLAESHDLAAARRLCKPFDRPNLASTLDGALLAKKHARAKLQE